MAILNRCADSGPATNSSLSFRNPLLVPLVGTICLVILLSLGLLGHSASAAWQSPDIVDGLDGTNGDVLSVQIGIDGQNHGVALSTHRIGSVTGLNSSRFDGTNWNATTPVDSGNLGQLRLSIHESGQAIALYDDVNHDLSGNTYDGTNWGSHQVIDPFGSRQSVEINSTGQAMAVFQSQGGVVASFFNGSSWSSLADIGAPTGSNANPRLAFNDAGQAVAVFENRPPEQDAFVDIWANRFDGTNWGTAELIGDLSNATDFFFGLDSDVAINSSGDAIAVFQQTFDDDGNPVKRLHSSVFDGNTWSDPIFFDADPQVLGAGIGGALMLDDSGDALAIRLKSGELVANRLDGASWSTLDSRNAGSISGISVDFNHSGHAAIAGEENNLAKAAFFDGTTFGAFETISDGPEVVRSPLISINEQGNAMAIWAELLDGKQRAWATLFLSGNPADFDNDGDVDGDDFLI